jgi:predicted nucleotidyltransferase
LSLFVRIVGLITEYNPFHNGHLHHLQESLRVTGADASVAVMSGHFLQRGEPALVDKWVRTEMALAAGVDLVLELPLPFACNSAPHFAMGAVRSLNALGVVDDLCFGSESGDLGLLDDVAGVLEGKEEEIEAVTATRLREGVNYPAARAEALATLLPELPAEQVASPNNILGIEYLRALRKTDSRIKPYTIERLGAGYHDTAVIGQVASATGLRKKLAEGEDVSALMPEACGKIFDAVLQAGRRLDVGKLFVSLQTLLLQNPETLDDIYLVSHGIRKRLALAALEANSFDEIAEHVKSRQWTLTRIQRTLMYVLLQAKASEMQAFLQSGPLFLRVLGHNRRGRQIMARARKRKTLPVISDPSRASNTLRKFYRDNSALGLLAEKMLQYDLRATQLYSLMQSALYSRYRNQDYYQPVRQV